MIERISQQRCFDGWQNVVSHPSHILDCNMRFGIYLPPKAMESPVPVLFWLSGLTCTEENFIIKAGAQRAASQLGVALISVDTSPRHVPIPGDHESFDFGVSAGYYLDALQVPWNKHYRMYSYIVDELFTLVGTHFSVDLTRAGIFGHSMGGHGALTIALKNPDKFKSVSAFAPICAPSQSPWGENAFKKYLGEDRTVWQQYDSVALMKERGWQGPEILIDQGSADSFLETQLKPELLREACQEQSVPLNLRMQPGYDHSYFFIASFIEDHIKHHLQCLSLA